MFHALIFLYAVLAAGLTAGNTEISGHVFDANTGEKLPSATILIEGSYRGTITNNDGYFTITPDELPVVLFIRYIGYQSQQVLVNPGTRFPLEIGLERSVTEMQEIVVTEQDPGLSIMELVIERKKLWRAGLHTYQADAYTRQLLSNDTTIVSVTESSSISFWDKVRGSREVQLSRRQTSNISDNQNFAGVRFLPNFYDDNIEIAGYNMMGVTHPNALRYYHFRLLETNQMDGKPVYKIEVTPRRIRQPLFEGTIWVLGRDYALLEVDLKPNDVVNFPPPVQDFNLAYKQQFSNYGGEYWLPVDMRIEGLIRIGMVGLRFPAINFSQVSRLSDYRINVDLPDSVYQSDDWLIRADSLTAAENRILIEPIPLSAEESLAYETIDSTKTLEEAFKPEGFLARMASASDERESSGNFFNAGGVIPEGFSLRGRFNRMDGYHLGLNFDRRFDTGKYRFKGFGGYSFNSSLWDYGGSANIRLVSIGNTRIHGFAGHENITATRYPSLFYSNGMNSIASVLGGDDYFDYFRNHSTFVGLEARQIIPRLNLTVTGRHEHHKNFEPESEFDHSWFGWHNTRRPNREIEEGRLQSVGVEIGYNVSSNDFGFAGKRQVIIGAEFSGNSIGSDYDFTKLGLRLDWNLQTFYKRRLFANTLDFHFSAGTTAGELPLQRFGAIDGSMNYFTPFGILKTRRFLPYEGERYWIAAAEHNFRTIPFELLGLQPLVDRGWGIILFGGAGYTDAGSTYPDDLMVTDGIHTEIGISLNSIFGILRIDFARRLDSPGTFIGISVPRYF
jgi:hypothetical protein